MGVQGNAHDAFDHTRGCQKSSEIGPTQAQALVAGRYVLGYDWGGTVGLLGGRSPPARTRHGPRLFAITLAHRGRTEESIREIKLAALLDPFCADFLRACVFLRANTMRRSSHPGSE
jgi:hypothetical protein